MGAKGEALAKQFEAKAREAATVVESLSDADWKKMTAAEKWTVGVTAHHLARAFEAVSGIVTGIVSGQVPGGFTRGMLDGMNAQHAKEHANCTKAETVALMKKGAPTAAAVVRGLSDDQLAKSGAVFTDAPPMTAEQLVMAGLINHIDEHIGSIRKAVGK
jgi:Mycothiol maleylpyruvate isomerase N-terminal domain